MIILVVGASALAIGLLVILNILIGGWTPARLRNEDEAAAALADGVFGFRAAAPVALAADGRGALAREAGGERLGLVVCLGDRAAVRALRPGDVRSIERDGVRLTLRLNDYTLPAAALRFSDAETAQHWAAEAEAYAGAADAAKGGAVHA